MLPRLTTGLVTYIDPGAATGWSLYEDTVLGACGLYRWTNHTCPHSVLGDIPSSAPCVVVEVPQYQHGDTPARINDLFITTRRGAEIAGALRPQVVHYIHPHEWKGGVPKAIHNERVLGRLKAQELKLYQTAVLRIPKLLHNNVIDAIGMGLVCSGRW